MNGVRTGTYVAKSKQTLAASVEEWLEAIERTVRPATLYSYAMNLRLHVLPHVGRTPLHAVDAGMLNSLYAALFREGRRNHGPADAADPPRVTSSGRPESVT